MYISWMDIVWIYIDRTMLTLIELYTHGERKCIMRGRRTSRGKSNSSWLWNAEFQGAR